MGDILDLAKRFWQGQVPPRDLWRPTHKSEELAPGVVFLHTWANVTAIRTDAGLVLVDTGNYAARADIYEARAQASDALMTRGIFSATARESAAKAGRAPCRAPGPSPTRGA
jgi:hypothetical protein